ncbi:substrate-binding domain-containing protein [Leucobacter luti]|uniref:Monosaccharide ABC transporter substrate-binding protein (CUT2 family) n=1 Tax=Leucobacter luti TaxID=340320 RepID=A0A4Q7U0W8_9MICO|nr:substrate-binding domain-containing protein [Leucobacter luti]RZT66168.1 monosaccharide ABC transporter substrate-binding protein (CUT2 family) [Leucobacter luti]
MKLRKTGLLIAGIAAASLMLTGCSVSTTPGGGSGSDGGAGSGEISIGFSQATQQSPFYVELGEGVKNAAEESGASLEYVDANGDVTKQNNDIEDLITRGVDVLLVNPVDPQGIAPSIASAKAAGIPVVTVDRSAEGTIAHVGRDNVAMGKLVGEAVRETLGDAGGKIIEIQGDAGGTVAMDRSEGFHQAFEGDDSVNIVMGPYAEYIRANAVTAMQDLLQSNPDVKVVYAHNDDMALGALQVLRESGRDDVLVAGVDGLMEAVDAIASGKQYIATSLNDPISLGSTAAGVALAAAAGEDVDAETDAGTELVTADNAADYVGDTLFAESK